MKTENYIFETTEPNQFDGDSAFPEKLEQGKVYVCIEYGSSVHLCPCGCGDKVFLGFKENVAYHPHLWTLNGNSFNPSIRKTIGCLSHYFIINGKVRWS